MPKDNDQGSIVLRPEVQWFAEQMELMLQANEHKGGWSSESSEFLLMECERNFDMLDVAVSNHTRASHTDSKELRKEWMAAIMRRSANVANFAMMVADNVRNEVDE
ncbi:hypothetical protein D3C71_234620 [compost metagenome]